MIFLFFSFIGPYCSGYQSSRMIFLNGKKSPLMQRRNSAGFWGNTELSLCLVLLEPCYRSYKCNNAEITSKGNALKSNEKLDLRGRRGVSPGHRVALHKVCVRGRWDHPKSVQPYSFVVPRDILNTYRKEKEKTHDT
ncbi:hypothetical protein BCR43DRAFT_351986 [Syncephalastrum racemosum]|uniref:Uncharacterized protein n=1 Tax=Syncephalastrum racemosum TaxID=13706 RepID=A0A1X2H697_SYNRA|nr:hypothetical protein BCR43DRAFT_351986 [Syncephalastrum racemosum]